MRRSIPCSHARRKPNTVIAWRIAIVRCDTTQFDVEYAQIGINSQAVVDNKWGVCNERATRGRPVFQVITIVGLARSWQLISISADIFPRRWTEWIWQISQTNVHAYLPDLLDLIEQGLLTPEEIVTHHMPLEDAARGYEIFEKREESCRKVILVPGMIEDSATIWSPQTA